MAASGRVRFSRRQLMVRSITGISIVASLDRVLGAEQRVWRAEDVASDQHELSLAASSAAVDVRSLAFFNTHTRESVRARFWAKGEYLADGLNAINRVLRDHRTGDVTAIDKRLLVLLHDLAATLESTDPFHVISGYRSPATNAMLRARSEGVAGGSLHMRGMAADLRVPGVPLVRLRDTAIAMQRGGVGFYPDSSFVHVDVGRVRSW